MHTVGEDSVAMHQSLCFVPNPSLAKLSYLLKSKESGARLCKNRRRSQVRDRLRCLAKSGAYWGFEAEINCYSRAMARGYACGRLEARARFQSIAALAT